MFNSLINNIKEKIGKNIELKLDNPIIMKCERWQK